MLSPKDTVKSMTLQHVGVDSLSRSSLAVGNGGGSLQITTKKAIGSHLSLSITQWTFRREISLLETSPLLFLNYASYFLITSVALVPPKPKLLDITVLSSTSRFSVTISRPLAASSRLSMLILGATKPCSSINVE